MIGGSKMNSDNKYSFYQAIVTQLQQTPDFNENSKLAVMLKKTVLTLRISVRIVYTVCVGLKAKQ